MNARLACVATFATAVVGVSGGAHAANLVTNGSFEAPSIVASNNYALYSTGSSAVTGWTMLGLPGESVQLTPDTYLGLKASDGRQWVDLTGITGYNKGVLSNTIAVVPGSTYTLAFDVGNYLPFGASTVGVSISGGAEQLFTNTSLAVTATNPMNWASFSMTWVATGSTANLSFLGRANGALSNGSGIGLDNVRFDLAPVPEPHSAWLLLAGLPMLGIWRRRTSRRL
jgi:Protein of unknown function (DUF642)